MGDPESSDGLKRSLSLWHALAIGVGTMVGAGIFVFPGLAAERAGTGAFFAFVAAGLVAFTVALCTAELATAMPRSGGVYFFVFRASHHRWAFLVGLSQWLGLIFATSFYLVGFLRYFDRFLDEIGFHAWNTSWFITIGIGTVLVAINIAGANWFGRAQNFIVSTLLVLLSVFILIGAGRMLGWLSPTLSVAPAFSLGFFPTISTAALIFTSFLGFVQIATVGGEIRNPERNLPAALLGSVAVVTVIYAVTLFVSTSVLPPEKMARRGETAMIAVARELLGEVGALSMLIAGLMATLSSANASILSASRAIYALSEDHMAPELLRKVSQRFGTPHYALLATGVPVVALVLVGRVEILAEVASCLHLMLYGLIAVVLLKMRWQKPDWYQPGFRVRGFPVIPIFAGLTCAGLITLMSPLSIAVAAGVLLIGGLLGWQTKQPPAKGADDSGS